MRNRIPANLLKVTTAILIAWVGYEGYSSVPYVPTKGDVPTIGNGATHYEDGRKVTMSDPAITRQRAAELSLNLLERTYAPCVRRSLGNTLVHPEEFENAVDFAGQYGCATWANSSMVTHMRQGEYLKACQSYTKYRFMTDNRYHAGWTEYKPGKWKFDCSTPNNKICRGVWDRQLDRYFKCMSVQ